MNSYSDQTITIDDLTTDMYGLVYKDERGSTFTNCTFQNTTEGIAIIRIDFSYALFTNCTWDDSIYDCLFNSAEGDTPQPTTVVFNTPPPVKWLPSDSINTILQGNGVKTEWVMQRVVEQELRDAFESTSVGVDGGGEPIYLTSDDYTLTMGKLSTDCSVGDAGSTRTEWLAVTTFEISTDAEDTYDPYDGVPDIPANGTSSCTITITAKDRAGDTKDDDTTVVIFKSTRGSLSSLTETMSDGVCSVDLTSVAETTVATVTAEIEGQRPLTIDIQFAPVT